MKTVTSGNSHIRPQEEFNSQTRGQQARAPIPTIFNNARVLPQEQPPARVVPTLQRIMQFIGANSDASTSRNTQAGDVAQIASGSAPSSSWSTLKDLMENSNITEVDIQEKMSNILLNGLGPERTSDYRAHFQNIAGFARDLYRIHLCQKNMGKNSDPSELEYLLRHMVEKYPQIMGYERNEIADTRNFVEQKRFKQFVQAVKYFTLPAKIRDQGPVVPINPYGKSRPKASGANAIFYACGLATMR